MLMGTGHRIEERREELGLSQADVARGVVRLGVKCRQTTIDKIEKRDTARPQSLREIAIVLGVTEEWLVTGRGVKLRPQGPFTPPLVVPIVTWVSAGRPSVSDGQDIIGEIRVSDLNPNGEWIALKVEGDSMDRISPPHSIILVDTKDTKLINNGCYIIDIGDGEITYKRYRSGPQRFEPVSVDQERHQTLYFKDPPRVIGRVKRSILEM